MNSYNSMDLGSQAKKSFDEGEQDANEDSNMQVMDDIFKRFSNYSSEDQGTTEIRRVHEEDEQKDDSGLVEIDDEKLKQQQLDNQCLDNNYWKVDMGFTLDDLLSESGER